MWKSFFAVQHQLEIIIGNKNKIKPLFLRIEETEYNYHFINFWKNYIQNYNYRIVFILTFITLIVSILNLDKMLINFLIFDFWFFLTLSLFKIFNTSKKFKIAATHFIAFSVLIILSMNYLELTLYYTKKNSLTLNINSNWSFFFNSEIFFYKYLYEFKNSLTSDNIFVSYANDTLQICVYSVYTLIFIIKNTSIDYKYKRLCI